ncbi:hypothetical protein SK128_004415 [Halocaridina rubra]|uniref:Ionotropic glutamate receptor L-glutamate and glycine-binding domain-containing protein n=1 Tax=Halocaridina rubra TaxID=373956 RepID=A0AAN8WFE5_HALRR
MRKQPDINDIFSLSYELVRNRDGGWGYRHPNGSWTGMVGMIQRKEVDFALGPLGVSGKRSTVVDFSTPLFFDQQVISYSRPKLEPDLIGFIRPFTQMMWLLLVLATIFVVLSTAGLLFLRFLWRRRDLLSSQVEESPQASVETMTDVEDRNWDFLRYVMWIYNILLGQAASNLSNNSIVRVLIGVWLLAAFIIGSVYKSNLAAMLIIPRISLMTKLVLQVKIPFNNLEEMLQQTDVPFFLQGGSVLYDTLKAAEKNSLFGRAWQASSASIFDYTEGLRMILEENFAIIVDKTTVLNILHSIFSREVVLESFMAEGKEGEGSPSSLRVKSSNRRPLGRIRQLIPLVMGIFTQCSGHTSAY